MKIRLPEVIELSGDNGSNVNVDLSKVEMTDDQRRALSSVYSKAMLSDFAHTITEEEFSKIADLKSIVNLDHKPAFIVRFDWEWVRIDEPKRTLEDLVKGRK